MGYSLVATGAPTVATTTGTQFATVSGYILVNVTESVRQPPLRCAARFDNLRGRLDAVGTSRSVVFRKGGVSGNQVINPTNTTAGLYQDLINSDIVASGDLIGYRLINTGTPIYFSIAMRMVAMDMQHASWHIGDISVNLSVASTTSFLPAGGGFTATNATEAFAQVLHRCTGSIDAIWIVVGTNTRSTATVLTLRKGGVDQANTISVGAGLTGLFEDTAHTTSIAPADLVCLKAVTGTGTGNFNTSNMGYTMKIPTGLPISDNFGAATTGNVRAASPTLSNLAIFGALDFSATFNDMSVRLKFPAKLTNARVRIQANTYTGTCTLTSRVNGANGNQTVAIATTLTGMFEDTTNSDLVGPDDDIALGIINGTAGNLTVAVSAITIEDKTVWTVPRDKRPIRYY